MRNDSDTRAAVAAAFASRDVTPLARVLGFTAEPLPLLELLAAVRERAGVDLASITSFGQRGTLACYGILCHAELSAADLALVTRTLRANNYAQLHLYLVSTADCDRCTVASFGLGETLLTLRLQHARLHAADLDTLTELVPAPDERGSALAARHARALDRSRVTRRFFADFAGQRDLLAAAWLGPPAQARRDRAQLALLLLSRLMFLYFLQHRGYLAGDSAYLVRRFQTWSGTRTFYAGTLMPLFFSVLNRRPERRAARVRSFGDLPYLNGGLFERHVLERKHRALDLPNAALAAVFEDLLERYRFTAREEADAHTDGVLDVGVDPEMLGRVFEGLMAESERAATGSFYTPAATVDRLVCNTLSAHLEPNIGEDAARALVRDGDATRLSAYQRGCASKLLREARVLDPACGSGAFLLGALARIAQTRAALELTDAAPVRRDVVGRSLYGVDLQGDAALLCALRLWLALVPAEARGAVQPLPNLDRQIRQGDTLIDPLDLRAAAADSEVRRCIAGLQPAAAAYVLSEPEERPALQRVLARSERQLARAWVRVLQQRVEYQLAELRAAARQKDLFGTTTEGARVARVELGNARRHSVALRRLGRAIRAQGERPFFSFRVHFPDVTLRGFDIVLCNPPWIRSHNWPRTITALVRSRYEVCRVRSWQPPHMQSPPPGGGHQTDLALLFLERAIELLAPGGALGIVLPAKFMRSLSGAPARRLLLERTDIVSIEDHSLDQRSIFAADAFAALIVARKRGDHGADSAQPAHVTCVRRAAAPLKFTIAQRDLPLLGGDTRAPWLLVPPDVRRALMRMRSGTTIGEQRALQIRRGIVTGANELLLLVRADPKLGGLAEIEAEGASRAAVRTDYTAVVEQDVIAPAVRGCDIAAWTFERARFVLCRTAATPGHLPHTAKYLARHRRAPADLPAAPEPRSCLAWHDLANTLKAVVLPGSIVPINTVYYMPLSEDRAHLFAAYFNSRPLRTFARAIAERAKDAHFRFFAWTVALLPLPVAWESFEAAHLREISYAAHAQGGIGADRQNQLDALIARAFGLTRADLHALDSFDAWLRGE